MNKNFLSKWSRTIKEGLPPFLFFNFPVEKVGIPVFEFHRVEAGEFRGWLQYLIGNHYQTLSFAEFFELIQRRKKPSGRAVLLTFDDGWLNQWETAFPILKELGQKAVFFINPTLTSHGHGHTGEWNFFDWAQAKIMVRSGLIEIHSHTLSHEQCFAGNEVVDFQHPLPDGKPCYNWLWSVTREKPGTPLWGMPVYRLKSRLLGPRYVDDPNLRQKCLDWAAQNGGIQFFSQPRWQKDLNRLVREHRFKNPGSGRWESLDEYRDFLRTTFSRSKAVIEAELGQPCSSVAFPWELGTAAAVIEAQRAGYQAVFWGMTALRRFPEYGQDPLRIERIQGCWIPSLPGRGRVSLWKRFR